MLLPHEKIPRQEGKEQKIMPSGESLHKTSLTSKYSGNETDTDITVPKAPMIKYAKTVPQALDIPKKQENALLENAGVAVKRSVDRFLKNLGRILYDFCKERGEDVRNWTLPPFVIVRLCKGALFSLPQNDRRWIDIDYFINALRHIPVGLLVEKDPDHQGVLDMPDIKELFALDAYVSTYEQINPKGETNAKLSGYHRGENGQPDFVFKNEQGTIMKKYDPLQLPRKDTAGSSETWLGATYTHHASGKSTGAVCILDVSDATEAQLDNWIMIFQSRYKSILEELKNNSPSVDELIYFCNTYVVSYDRDTEGEKVKKLQGIFDTAREFLGNNIEYTQLEAWREREMKGVFFKEQDTGSTGATYEDMFNI